MGFGTEQQRKGSNTASAEVGSSSKVSKEGSKGALMPITCCNPASYAAHVHKTTAAAAAAAQLLQHIFGFDRGLIYFGERLRSCIAVVAFFM